MNKNLNYLLSIFDRELKRSKTKPQAKLLYEICKSKIDRMPAPEHEKKMAINYITLKKELNHVQQNSSVKIVRY